MTAVGHLRLSRGKHQAEWQGEGMKRLVMEPAFLRTPAMQWS